jgi:glycosyltransferase involved in cell wall biosynthesis
MLLCNYLLQYHQVSVLCFEEEKPGEYKYECPIIRLPILTQQGLVGKMLAGIKRIRAVKKVKNEFCPDVSIAFGNTAIILNALSATGEKKVASIRQSFSVIIKDRSVKMRIHLKFYLWAIRRSEVVVPVSKAINDELAKHFNISNEVFINNGFSSNELTGSSVGAPLFMKEGRKWLVHAGRFDRSKGHWHLVKIFAEIKRHIPNLGLIMLGDKDTSSHVSFNIENYCKEYLTRQNISWGRGLDSTTDVLFAGHQSNPLAFIRHASLFVFPSLWEGFPNALLEAMSCGVPVVAADCATGPREILQENNEAFGLLLPTFRDSFDETETTLTILEKHWAKNIIELLKDERRLAYFGQQAKKRSAKYSVENMGKQWLELIER